MNANEHTNCDITIKSGQDKSTESTDNRSVHDAVGKKNATSPEHEDNGEHSDVQGAQVREVDYMEYCVVSRKDEEAVEITSMAPLRDTGGMLVCDHCNGEVKLLDRAFRQTHKYCSVFKPWGAAVLDEEFIVVTFPFVRLMQYFKFQDGCKKLAPWFPIKSQNEYYGVTGNKQRIVAVCRHDGENMSDTPGVHIMARGGIVLHFVRKDSQGRQLFVNPDHIALNKSTKLVYVSDSGTHSVVCLNLEGELVRTFSAPELSPRGVTVDQANGNIYVCECNSESVLRLNCDLLVVEKLKLKGDTLQNLMAISHCSKTDRLAVSSESTPFVKVFVV